MTNSEQPTRIEVATTIVLDASQDFSSTIEVEAIVWLTEDDAWIDLLSATHVTDWVSRGWRGDVQDGEETVEEIGAEEACDLCAEAGKIEFECLLIEEAERVLAATPAKRQAVAA